MPIVTAPTLLDYSRICARPSSRPSPRGSASWISRSATWMLGGSVNLLCRRDDAVGERAGDRDELEDRARLVDVGHGAVLVGGPVGSLPKPWKPSLRHVGHGEDLAGPRVHHDGDRRLAAGVAHGLLEDVLGVVLDLAVERETHVLAGHRLLLRDGLERRARRGRARRSRCRPCRRAPCRRAARCRRDRGCPCRRSRGPAPPCP